MYDIIRYRNSKGEVKEFVPSADGSSILSIDYDVTFIDISVTLEPPLEQNETRAWSASKSDLQAGDDDPYFKGYFLSGEYGLRLVPTENPDDIKITFDTYTAARVDLVQSGTFISNDNTLSFRIEKVDAPAEDSTGFETPVFDSQAPLQFEADNDFSANDIFANRGFFSYINVDSMDAGVIRVDSLYTDNLYLDSLHSRIITADSAIINNAIIRGGSLTADTLEVSGGNIVELTSQLINVDNYILGKDDNIISYINEDSANIYWDRTEGKWRIDPGIFNNATLDDLNNLFPTNLNDGFLTYDKDNDVHSLDYVLRTGRFVYDDEDLETEVLSSPLGYIHKLDSDEKVEYYNQWIRFSHQNERFTEEDPAITNQPWKSDEAERWFYSADSDVFSLDSATVSFAGIVSRNVVGSYEIQATFSSTDTSNGVIALVLAHVEDTDDQGNTKEHTLSLIRRPKNYFDVSGLTPADPTYPGPSETTAYSVVYNYKQTDEKYLEYDFYNNIAPSPTPVTQASQNLDDWASAGATRVYAKKVSSRVNPEQYTIVVKCSQFGSTTIDESTTLTIYLDQHEETKRFMDRVRFGFGSTLQNNVLIEDVTIKELDENSNLVFDLKNDRVFHYVAEEELSDRNINVLGVTAEGHYIFDHDESYKDFYPSARFLHNRRTKKTYYVVDDAGITNPIELVSGQGQELGIRVEARGTSQTSGDAAYLYIDNDKIYETQERGLKLTIVNSLGDVLSQTLYNTADESNSSNNLATALTGMLDKQIGIITSSVNYTGSFTQDLRTAAKSLGLIKLANSAQSEIDPTSYAAIFQKNAGLSIRAHEITNGKKLNQQTQQQDEGGGAPGIEQIFSTWYRFSHLPSGFTYPAILSEANSWSYDSANDAIVSGANTASYTGFVSDVSSTDYTLEVDMASTGADDDAMSIVVAFGVEGTLGQPDYREHTLSAVRTMGGYPPTQGFGLYYNFRQPTEKLVGAEVSIPFVSGGWAANGNTRLRVVKTGSQLSVISSQNGSTVLDSSTEIAIDLSTDPDLVKFQNDVRIGFGAASQNDASFTRIISTFPSFTEEPVVETGPTSGSTLQATLARSTYFVMGGDEISGFVSYDGEYVAFVDSRGSLNIDEDHSVVLASGEFGGIEFDKNSPEMKMRVLNTNELHFTVPDNESVKINNHTVWNDGNVSVSTDNENIFDLDSANRTFTYLGPKLTSDNTSVLSFNPSTHTFTYVGPKLTSDNTNILSLNVANHTFTYIGPKVTSDNEDVFSLDDATHTFTYVGPKFTSDPNQSALNFDSATNSFTFDAPKIVSLVSDNLDVLSLDSSITTFFYVGPKVSTDNTDLFDLDSTKHAFTYVGPKVTTDNASVFDLDSASHTFSYVGPKLVTNDAAVLSLNQSTHTFTFDINAIGKPSLVSDNTSILSLVPSTQVFTYVGPKVTSDNTDLFDLNSTTHTFTYKGPKVSTDNASVFDLDSASHTFSYLGPKLVSNDTNILSLNQATHTFTFDANALSKPSLTTDNTNILSLNTATVAFTYVGPKMISDNTDLMSLDSASHKFTYVGPKVSTDNASVFDLDSASHTFSYVGPKLVSNNTNILSLNQATHTFTFDADALNVPSLVTDNTNILSLDPTIVEFNYVGPKIISDNTDIFDMDSLNHVFTYVGPKMISDNTNILSLDSASHKFTYVGPKLISDNTSVMSLNDTTHTFTYVGPKLITDDTSILSLNPTTHTFTFNSANISGTGGGTGGGCTATIYGGTAISADMLVSYADSCSAALNSTSFTSLKTGQFEGLTSGAKYLVEYFANIYWPDGPGSLTVPELKFTYQDSGGSEVVVRSGSQNVTQYTPIFAHYVAIPSGTAASLSIQGKDGFNRTYKLYGATFKLTRFYDSA